MKPTDRRLCIVCRLQRIAFCLLLLLAIPALVWAREPQHAPVPELPGKVEGGLTAEEVASRAEHTSPDLESKEREVDAAAAQVDAVLVGFFPRLQGDVSYTRLSYVAPSELPLGVQAPGPGTKSATTSRASTRSGSSRVTTCQSLATGSTPRRLSRSENTAGSIRAARSTASRSRPQRTATLSTLSGRVATTVRSDAGMGPPWPETFSGPAGPVKPEGGGAQLRRVAGLSPVGFTGRPWACFFAARSSSQMVSGLAMYTLE